MKKLICLLLCLACMSPLACAEDFPRFVEEGGAGYAWLYDTSLTVAGRFQRGLNSTWHSFLLSAANVPEEEMVEALSLLRLQDYNQPRNVTIVRADRLLPEETVQAWLNAITQEEADKTARAARRALELIGALTKARTALASPGIDQLPQIAAKSAEKTAENVQDAGAGPGGSQDDWENWDLGWDSLSGEQSASAVRQEEETAASAADDFQAELYHSVPAILNAREDGLFPAISGALKVTGLYPCLEALDSPCCAVIDYGGPYALLITFCPAEDGFISVSAQAIYSRSIGELLMPQS